MNRRPTHTPHASARAEHDARAALQRTIADAIRTYDQPGDVEEIAALVETLEAGDHLSRTDAWRALMACARYPHVFDAVRQVAQCEALR